MRIYFMWPYSQPALQVVDQVQVYLFDIRMGDVSFSHLKTAGKEMICWLLEGTWEKQWWSFGFICHQINPELREWV